MSSDAANSLHRILVKDKRTWSVVEVEARGSPSDTRHTIVPETMPDQPQVNVPTYHEIEDLAYPSLPIRRNPFAQLQAPRRRKKVTEVANAHANAVADDSTVDSSKRQASNTPHKPRSSTHAGNNTDSSSSTLSLTSLMSTPTTPPHSSAEESKRTPPSNPVASQPPYQGPIVTAKERSIWDPDDSEWETSFSSATITSTFTSSFRAPLDRTVTAPAKASALGRWGTTVRDTWRTIRALSPTKRDAGDGHTLGHQNSSYEEEKEEEERRDKLEMLGNAYYFDPNGDMHDEVVLSCFVAESRYFPALSTPSPRQMNILSLSNYFSSEDELLQDAKPRLNIAIPTILSHTSTACLAAFLDPRVEEFIYCRYIDRSASGLVLVVRRCGNKIIAGAYRNFGFKLQWVAYVKSVVGIRGDWVEIYAAVGPGYTDIRDGLIDWEVFWPDGESRQAQRDVTGPRRLALARPEETERIVEEDVSPVEPKFMLYQSRVLGRALLWDIWARFEGLNECRATWEADGVVTGVRLQRSLLGVGDEDEE